MISSSISFDGLQPIPFFMQDVTSTLGSFKHIIRQSYVVNPGFTSGSKEGGPKVIVRVDSSQLRVDKKFSEIFSVVVFEAGVTVTNMGVGTATILANTHMPITITTKHNHAPSRHFADNQLNPCYHLFNTNAIIVLGWVSGEIKINHKHIYVFSAYSDSTSTSSYVSWGRENGVYFRESLSAHKYGAPARFVGKFPTPSPTPLHNMVPIHIVLLHILTTSALPGSALQQQKHGFYLF
jgi:hypothetical protein